MRIYRYNREGHPEHGTFHSTPDDLTDVIEAAQVAEAQEPGAGGDYAWYVPADQSELRAHRQQRQAGDISRRRRALLAASDWTQLMDSPLTDAERAAWAAYRAAVRGDPPWPDPPR